MFKCDLREILLATQLSERNCSESRGLYNFIERRYKDANNDYYLYGPLQDFQTQNFWNISLDKWLWTFWNSRWTRTKNRELELIEACSVIYCKKKRTEENVSNSGQFV
jgi:hypothetical protein